MNHSVWTPDQVAAAIGIIVAAICANSLIVARTFAQIRDIVEGLNRTGVPIRGAKGAAGGSGGHSLGNGGKAVITPSLLPLDSIAQRSGVTVSTDVASTGPYDCGPACVVSEIENIHGCWSADELLRLRYFGVVDNRLTTGGDLVGMLRANNIAAHERNTDSPTAKLEMLRNFQAGRTSFALGEWVSPGVGHWMRFRGDDGLAQFMDPWLGGPRSITWETFARQFWGSYVHVDVAAPPAVS